MEGRHQALHSTAQHARTTSHTHTNTYIRNLRVSVRAHARAHTRTNLPEIRQVRRRQVPHVPIEPAAAAAAAAAASTPSQAERLSVPPLQCPVVQRARPQLEARPALARVAGQRRQPARRGHQVGREPVAALEDAGHLLRLLAVVRLLLYIYIYMYICICI